MLILTKCLLFVWYLKASNICGELSIKLLNSTCLSNLSLKLELFCERQKFICKHKIKQLFKKVTLSSQV